MIGIESQLGFVDVKTVPIHFYVQRYSSYFTRGVVPWENAQVNVGNAMNLTSGLFMAPKNGIYQFHFSGINSRVPGANDTDFLGIYIRRNEVWSGKALGSTRNYETGSLHSTFKLKRGDRIDLFLWTGGLFDSSDNFSHFTGWLDAEDLQL